MSILFTSLEQALVLLPLVLGMYLSFKVLKVTDLTVDGTYVLGAVIFAKTIHIGVVIAFSASLIAGVMVGAVVSYMQRYNIVNDLIVGILASFMLYSINLQVLGRPNFSLISKPNILNLLKIDSWILALTLIAIILLFILTIFLNSRLGLFLKAFGCNHKLLVMLGKSPEKYRFLGLILSNALAALSGCLAAQINGFADVNMGIGVALVSIGAIMLGTQIFKKLQKFNAAGSLFSCFLGILLYFLTLNSLLKIGIEPTNLKLMLGISLFMIMKKLPNKISL